MGTHPFRTLAARSVPAVGLMLLMVTLLAGATTARAAFPGQNGKIAFHVNRGFEDDIYVMDADGSSETQLTNNYPAGDTRPAWSPDGTKIVFQSNRDGNEEIYVMNADGTGQTNLTTNPADDLTPTWSSDGSKIAFATLRDGNNEIYVMNADGTAPTNLTNDPAFDVAPSWSPDGSKIAFSAYRDGNQEIYVMNPDGTAPTNLTNNPAEDNFPDWSPDGSKIAFLSARVDSYDVYVMNADGTAQANLTNNPADDYMPSWSPDGSKIVFPSYRDANMELYKMNADGTAQTRLTTTTPDGEFDPSWQPLTGEVVDVVVPPGGSASTDSENDGATAADPVETSVTTPEGGNVTISEHPTSTSDPSGFELLGQQVDITADPATPEDPLVVTFLLDAGSIPAGEDENTIAIFKNGVGVPACSGPPGQANPDPCVSDRSVLPDGDVSITILTSTASAWNFGVVPCNALTAPVSALVHDVHGMLGDVGDPIHPVDRLLCHLGV